MNIKRIVCWLWGEHSPYYEWVENEVRPKRVCSVCGKDLPRIMPRRGWD